MKKKSTNKNGNNTLLRKNKLILQLMDLVCCHKHEYEYGSCFFTYVFKYNPSNITLLTLYKSFIHPHLEYGDFIHDKTSNESYS